MSLHWRHTIKHLDLIVNSEYADALNSPEGAFAYNLCLNMIKLFKHALIDFKEHHKKYYTVKDFRCQIHLTTETLATNPARR